MPITGPSSYITTVPQFIDHWEAVNTALGAQGPLVLRAETVGAAADVTRAALDSLFNTLSAQHVTVQTALVVADLAVEELNLAKADALAKLNMFNEKVRALLAGTKWERALTQVPTFESGQGRFTAPLVGAQALWTLINQQQVLGGNTPLVLRDGTTLGNYEDLMTALPALYREVIRTEQALKLEREERNDQQDVIYPILRQYRVAVAASFAEESAIMATLPRLTPAPGHTPEGVQASGAWDGQTQQARLQWTESEDPELDHYSIRHSPGTAYHPDEEDTIGRVEPGGALEFLTTHGLEGPGAAAFYRVYEVLRTGNEKGSNDVRVERPA